MRIMHHVSEYHLTLVELGKIPDLDDVGSIFGLFTLPLAINWGFPFLRYYLIIFSHHITPNAMVGCDSMI